MVHAGKSSETMRRGRGQATGRGRGRGCAPPGMHQHIDATDDDAVMRQAIAENLRKCIADRDETNRQADAADMARIETLDYRIARLVSDSQ